MNTKSTKKNMHLTLDDRIEIQQCLSHGMSFKAIGKRIGKDPTTVSKEVKRHMVISPTKIKRTDSNGQIVIAICPKLLKPPYVCNSCPKVHSACGFDRHTYYAKQANAAYQKLLSEAREGVMLNKQEFFDTDAIISEGMKNGQHLFHIAKSNVLYSSIPTVYRHLKKGLLSVSSLDFPRIVKFKGRKKQASPYIPKKLKIGRSYLDFELFLEQEDISSWCETDTVIGRIGGKAILTFSFVPCNFMFGFLLDNNDSIEVTKNVITLKNRLLLEHKSFADFAKVLLTDNGGEFANVFAFENNLNGVPECKLFFCDPMQSNQKAHIEKNHTLLRDILPKGTSFDNLTQESLNLVFSHVNSVKRQAFAGKSAYEMFSFIYGKEAPALFNITEISPSNVIQSPKLLKLLGIRI